MIRILRVYRHNKGWVFDDPAVGLRKEPLVMGIDRMLDTLAGPRTKEVYLTFSDQPFDHFNVELEWVSAEDSGNWYRSMSGITMGIMGWLCPALYKYFSKAPSKLFLEVVV